MKKLIFLLPFLAFTLHAKDFPLLVLHTTDLHSQIAGDGPDALFTPMVGDGDPVRGHYARLAYLIKKIQKENAGTPMLLLDSGDFYSGSIFQFLSPSKEVPYSPEYEFFKEMKYDATTFGNHEFDLGKDGLISFLKKVSVAPQVPIISTSLQAPTNSALVDFVGINKIVSRDLVKEFSYQGQKIRVGILGMTGFDALRVSVGQRRGVSFVGFDDEKMQPMKDEFSDLVRKSARTLKKEKRVDLVFLLLHGGLGEYRDILEDIEELDLVLGGHSHESYDLPEKVGHTYFHQNGKYGRYLGVLPFSYDGHKLNFVGKEGSVQVNDHIPADADMLSVISRYERDINLLIKAKGYSLNTPIFQAKENLPRVYVKENRLGRFVTTVLREEYEKKVKKKIDFYFTALSLIRSELKTGEKPFHYNYSDIFRMLSVGSDQDSLPGTPVIDFYLSKGDVKKLIDTMLIYRYFSPNFLLMFSEDLKYEVREWGIPYINRLKDLSLRNQDYDQWSELVHVATSLYVAQFLSKVKKITHGLVDIIPRDAKGRGLDQFTILPESSMKEYDLFSHHFAPPLVREP